MLSTRHVFARAAARSFRSCAARGLLLLVGGGLLTAAGCGSQTYETRLEESRKYFEYRQTVDDALDSNRWQNFGIDFRTPKGFREIPGPAAAGDADLRQPNFLSAPLPGLAGAWQGEARVEIVGSQRTRAPMWLFLCTNHQRHLDRFSNPGVQPAEFRDDLAGVLADSLGYARNTAVNPWKFDEMRTPSGTAYVKRKSWDAIKLQKDIPVDGESLLMDFRLHRYDVGEIQFCLVSVAPAVELLDRRERLDPRLDLAMETVTVSGDVPRTQARATSSGGGF